MIICMVKYSTSNLMRMPRSMLRGIGFICIIAVCGWAQQPKISPENQAILGAHRINIHRVVEHVQKGMQPNFEITYDYDFHNRDSVYVPGLGDAPAKGSFSYITRATHLQFLDSAKGHAIATVVLKPTAYAMGSDSVEIPQIGDFPSLQRTGFWVPSITFPVAAQAVIQKYFPSGYQVQEIGTTNYYITGYRDLDQSDPQLISQVALMISAGSPLKGEQLEYAIQFIARDKPRLSSIMRYGDDRSELTVKAASQFISQFLADLKAEKTLP